MKTGLIRSSKDVRDYKLKNGLTEDFPREFLLDKLPIKNQQDKPTCAAHTLSSLVEFHTRKETNKYHRYSTNFIYGKRDNTIYEDEEGMCLRDGLNVLYKYGDLLYEDCPGNYNYKEAKEEVDSIADISNNSNITTYYKVSSIDEIKYALLNDGPIVAGIKLFENCSLYRNVFTFFSTKNYEYHAVLIVGWTADDKLIIQNSWGRMWGDNGYFYVRFSDIEEALLEMYGVTDNIDTVIRPYSKIEFIAKMINIILNTILKIFNKK